MPKNLDVPPALVALHDQINASYRVPLNSFLDIATEGFERGYNETTILGVLGCFIDDIVAQLQLDKDQCIYLIAMLVMDMARAQHQGDWA